MALKRVRGAGQPRGHVAAVAAPEHADPVGVGGRAAPQRLVEHGQHVLDVDRAPTRARGAFGMVRAHDGLAPGRLAARRAAGVAHHHDVAGGGLDLRLVEEPVAVLGERAAVDVQEDGVAARPDRSRAASGPSRRPRRRRWTGRRSARPARSPARATNRSVTVVSRRSGRRPTTTNSSAGRSTVLAVKASVPPARSSPVTTRSPPTSGCRGAAPSAARPRYTWTLPRSSHDDDEVVAVPDRRRTRRGTAPTCGRAPVDDPTALARLPGRARPTWRVLRVGQRVVDAEEGDPRPVRRDRRLGVHARLRRSGRAARPSSGTRWRSSARSRSHVS